MLVFPGDTPSAEFKLSRIRPAAVPALLVVVAPAREPAPFRRLVGRDALRDQVVRRRQTQVLHLQEAHELSRQRFAADFKVVYGPLDRRAVRRVC